MKDFWDKRYDQNTFAYGKQPNKFFRNRISTVKPGNLLLPAEGEGRNAVYAATLGWQVTAVDFSVKGRDKALQLADEHGVTITYKPESVDEVNLSENSFDACALIYVHLPENVYSKLFKKIAQALKPGGQLVIEGYSKKQLGKPSGGPKDESLLYSLKQVKGWLSDYKIELLKETNVELNEGVYHRGEASVIRALATKK